MKNCTVLDDGINIRNRKCVFWQTSINNQRTELRMHINGIVIVGLIDMGTDVSIITRESWCPNWSFQEADVHLITKN